MRYDYLVVDVFSPAPFGGNQLAVVTDARGITAPGMQAIAREFNFAESTFVLPPSGPRFARHVRIFTPAAELPFAGHPTVGTACALVMAGALLEGEMIFEEGIGPVSARVERRDGALAGTLTLERGPDLSDDVAALGEIASVLSLPEADVADAFCAGAGVSFTFVRLARREAVDAASLDLSHWQRVFAGRWGAQLFLFSGELADGAELYARMFAPGLGVAEDPATGSAVAALVGAAALRTRPTAANFALTVVQGVKMGRKSVLECEAELEDGQVRLMKVAGACAFVAEGRIEVPPAYLES